jgi:hypothetical protein
MPSEPEIMDYCNAIAQIEADDHGYDYDTSPYTPVTVWDLARQRVAIECEQWEQAVNHHHMYSKRVIALMSNFPHLRQWRPPHDQ